MPWCPNGPGSGWAGWVSIGSPMRLTRSGWVSLIEIISQSRPKDVVNRKAIIPSAKPAASVMLIQSLGRNRS